MKTKRTQQQLADNLGISLATYKRRLATGKIAGDKLEDAKRRAEIVKLQAEGDKAVRLFEIIDGKYCPRHEVEDSIAQIAIVHGSYRSAMESEFPSLLVGMTEPQIEDEAKRFNDQWALKLQDASSAVWEAARAAVEKQLRGDLKKVAAGSQG